MLINMEYSRLQMKTDIKPSLPFFHFLFGHTVCIFSLETKQRQGGVDPWRPTDNF